jgi:serine/threonine-protein kinase
MIGTRLGPWIIDEELGRGGMGRVFLAHADPAPAEGPQKAALKVLAAELAVETGFRQRFQREIDILRKLDHPNIVRFHGSGEQDGRFYFVMEYVDGPSYETLRLQQGKLPWPEVLALALQITPALKHAHDRGVIHRDLKPSNLLRGIDGVIKLTDFGIASLFASQHLTVTGGIVGTAEYLSPEQAAGKPVTRRSDLYSLGVVLYTLLTGRTPFEGEVLDLLHKHRFAQFDRPSRFVPEMPHDLDEIVCQLLHKDPAERPADGAVLFRRLDGLRRKIEYKAAAEQRVTPSNLSPAHNVATGVVDREGPATLMSRLMREELDRQNRGGPGQRFLNHPWVLLTLFLLTLGTIIWTFWPMSDEAMFQRGAAMMTSDDPNEWERAWKEYLKPLDQKYAADHPRRAELDEYRRRAEAASQARKSAVRARQAGPMSEAQWFYQQGLRLRQQGDEEGARRLWHALTLAFKEVPTEEAWVRLAEKELAEGANPRPGEREWKPVEEAVKQAARLREAGKDAEATAILRALEELYRDDPAGRKMLEEK